MKMPKRSNNSTPSPDEANALAVTVLTWLAGQPDLFGRFLALSGLEADQLRHIATEPGFASGLTSFLMNHEPTLLAFCDDNDVSVEFVQSCHRLLAGPDDDVWL